MVQTARPSFSSRYIAQADAACLLLPESGVKKGVILLHGAQENPNTLLQNIPLCALAEELRLAVLLPPLGNSFGLDWGDGLDYRSFLMRELLPWAREQCPVFSLRTCCVIGGVSMGGFAALSLALSFPESFCGAFSISGSLDVRRAAQFCRICGIPIPEGLSQLKLCPEAQLSAMPENSACAKPALYMAWGDEDWFIEANTAFAAKAKQLHFPLSIACGPGRHDWHYWEKSLPAAISWAAALKCGGDHDYLVP